MKKPKYIFLVILFVLSGISQLFPQEIPSTDIFKAIENTDIGQATKMPFYVLGWSKDGKFSFITMNSGGGRGGSIYNFCVIDTLTDTYLYQKTIDTFDFYENGKDFDIDQITNNIVKNEIIPKFNIVYNPKAKFLTFPFTIDGIVYKADLDLKTRPANKEIDFSDQPVIISYQLNITRSGFGKKTISAANIESKTNESIYILGAIKSPFEEKMVVLYTFNFFNMCWGADLVPTISGCKLDSGFKIDEGLK